MPPLPPPLLRRPCWEPVRLAGCCSAGPTDLRFLRDPIWRTERSCAGGAVPSSAVGDAEEPGASQMDASN